MNARSQYISSSVRSSSKVEGYWTYLEDGALGSLLGGNLRARVQYGTARNVRELSGGGRNLRHKPRGSLPDGLVENALEVSLGQCRALEVLVSPDLLGTHQSLLV